MLSLRVLRSYNIHRYQIAEALVVFGQKVAGGLANARRCFGGLLKHDSARNATRLNAMTIGDTQHWPAGRRWDLRLYSLEVLHLVEATRHRPELLVVNLCRLLILVLFFPVCLLESSQLVFVFPHLLQQLHHLRVQCIIVVSELRCPSLELLPLATTLVVRLLTLSL